MMDLYVWLSFYEMEDKRYLCLIQESQTLWYNLNSPHFWEVL